VDADETFKGSRHVPATSSWLSSHSTTTPLLELDPSPVLVLPVPEDVVDGSSVVPGPVVGGAVVSPRLSEIAAVDSPVTAPVLVLPVPVPVGGSAKQPTTSPPTPSAHPRRN
jgi:hypothetical protein